MTIDTNCVTIELSSLSAIFPPKLRIKAPIIAPTHAYMNVVGTVLQWLLEHRFSDNVSSGRIQAGARPVHQNCHLQPVEQSLYQTSTLVMPVHWPACIHWKDAPQ